MTRSAAASAAIASVALVAALVAAPARAARPPLPEDLPRPSGYFAIAAQRIEPAERGALAGPLALRAHDSWITSDTEPSVDSTHAYWCDSETLDLIALFSTTDPAPVTTSVRVADATGRVVIAESFTDVAPVTDGISGYILTLGALAAGDYTITVRFRQGEFGRTSGQQFWIGVLPTPGPECQPAGTAVQASPALPENRRLPEGLSVAPSALAARAAASGSPKGLAMGSCWISSDRLFDDFSTDAEWYDGESLSLAGLFTSATAREVSVTARLWDEKSREVFSRTSSGAPDPGRVNLAVFDLGRLAAGRYKVSLKVRQKDTVVGQQFWMTVLPVAR